VRTILVVLCSAVALFDASEPGIVLTLPVPDDPQNCFPHGSAPITIAGDRVTSIQLPENRKIAFTDGLAPIRSDGKWGYMDTQQRIVIAPRFDRAESFSQDRAVVTVGGRYGYIDRAGTYIAEPQFSWGFRFYRGVAAVRSGDRWGLIGLDGEWVVRPRFTRIDLLVGGLFAETSDGEQGFIDARGAFIRSEPLGAYYQPAK
jgi:hypothetical protein